MAIGSVTAWRPVGVHTTASRLGQRWREFRGAASAVNLLRLAGKGRQQRRIAGRTTTSLARAAHQSRQQPTSFLGDHTSRSRSASSRAQAGARSARYPQSSSLLILCWPALAWSERWQMDRILPERLLCLFLHQVSRVGPKGLGPWAFLGDPQGKWESDSKKRQRGLKADAKVEALRISGCSRHGAAASEAGARKGSPPQAIDRGDPEGELGEGPWPSAGKARPFEACHAQGAAEVSTSLSRANSWRASTSPNIP